LGQRFELALALTVDVLVADPYPSQTLAEWLGSAAQSSRPPPPCKFLDLVIHMGHRPNSDLL